MAAVTSLGLASGLDLESLVTNLVIAEGTPAAVRLDTREAGFLAEISAFGSFRSALDTFDAALAALNKLESFQERNVTSSNEEIFTATGDSDAVPGSYDVEVVALAEAHKLSSANFTDSETYVGTGTLTFAVNEVSFDVAIDAEAATLADIRDAINEAEDNTTVQATIINGEDGSYLVLTGEDTGEENTITVTASGGDGGLDQLVYDPDGGITNLTELNAAVDAEIRIDTVTVKSASNSVAGAIDGLTLELISAEPGTVETLAVELDTVGTSEAVQDFVNSYNALMGTIGDLTSYDVDTQIAGTLQGDSLVLRYTDQLRRELSTPVEGLDGPLAALVDIGITTNLDGTLELDQEKLDEVLASNFDDIGELLAAENGYATRFTALTQTYIEEDGYIDVRVDGLEDSIDGIAEERAALDQHLIEFEQRIRADFVALDLLIAELTATSEFLGAQLALLPSPNVLLGG